MTLLENVKTRSIERKSAYFSPNFSISFRSWWVGSAALFTKTTQWGGRRSTHFFVTGNAPSRYGSCLTMNIAATPWLTHWTGQVFSWRLVGGWWFKSCGRQPRGFLTTIYNYNDYWAGKFNRINRQIRIFLKKVNNKNRITKCTKILNYF